jgi:hypothetical protein
MNRRGNRGEGEGNHVMLERVSIAGADQVINRSHHNHIRRFVSLGNSATTRMADLSITHDPWRADVHPPPIDEVDVPTSPRKGKQRETEDAERGVWARLGTMERLSVLSRVVDSSNGRDKVL